MSSLFSARWSPHFSWLSRLALVLICCWSPTVADGAVSVMIHDDVVLHSVSQDYTGTNFVSYWNSIGPTAGTISDLQASRFAMIRFPGGVPCDWFDWQNPGPGNWGILDAKAIAQPSGAKIVYQTNIYDAGLTGQNTAATVTAIDAFMKANGVEVGMWEGGNEPEYGPRQGQPAATYMSEYNTNYGIQYTALKAVSPTIPMIDAARPRERRRRIRGGLRRPATQRQLSRRAQAAPGRGRVRTRA